MSNQNIKLLDRKMHSISIQTDFNNNRRIIKKSIFDVLFEHLLNLFGCIILYISLGYVSYAFSSFFGLLFNDDLVITISKYQCYNLFSLCFFIQVFSLLLIIIFGYFVYYLLIRYK